MVGGGHAGATCRVEVLGPTRVRVDGAEVRLSPQGRVLVTRLALAGGDQVRVDAVADSLWHGDLPASYRKVIHNRVVELRRHHAALISSDGDAYGLGRGVAIDCDELEATLAGVTGLLAGGDPTTAAELAARVSGSWRGAPFLDLEHPDVPGRRVALEECRHLLSERRAEALLRCRDPAGAVVVLEELVNSTPLVERRWWLLMMALYVSQRRSEALRTYQRVREILRDEAGLSPGPELVELEQDVLASRSLDLDGILVTGRAREATAVRTGGRVDPGPVAPKSVPLYATSFVGRAGELREVLAALRDERVVTLLGPPGVGKTRLAVEAITSPQCEAPSIFVPLGPINDPVQVIAAVGAACGVSVVDPDDPAGALAAELAERPLLVVLDTCEHQIDIVRSLVERASGSASTFLLTSRVRLEPALGAVIEVGPLDPGDGVRPGPALELFESRARDELFDELDLDVALRVVRALDGLPLAIEMAAAQLRWTGIDELAAMVEEHVGTLDLPARRSGAGRYLTLEQTFRWSYDLLDPESQAVLRSLAVFRGGFRTDAVAAVTGRSTDELGPVLRGLVDRSLLVAERRRPARFRMLVSIGMLVEEELRRAGEEPEARERHFLWCERFVRSARQGGSTAQEAEWVGRVDRETPNLLAAIARARASGQHSRAAALVGPLIAFAIAQAHPALLTVAGELSNELPTDPEGDAAPGVAMTVALAAWAALRRMDFSTAQELAARSIGLASDDDELAECLMVAASVAISVGEVDKLRALAASGEVAARRAGNAPCVVLACGLRAIFADVAPAEPQEELLRACVAAAAEVDSPRVRGWAEYVTGTTLQERDPLRAVDHLGEALRHLEAVEARFFTDLVLRSLGDVLVAESAAAGVSQLLLATRSQLAAGDVTEAYRTASWLCRPLVALGHYVEAVMVEAVVASGADPLALETGKRRRVAAVATARSALGPTAFHSASVFGATSTLADVIKRIGELDLAGARSFRS